MYACKSENRQSARGLDVQVSSESRTVLLYFGVKGVFPSCEKEAPLSTKCIQPLICIANPFAVVFSEHTSEEVCVVDITMMPFCVELVSLILGPFILLFSPRCRSLTIRGCKQTSPIWTASLNDVQS